ncbi:GTP cyclohydrolase I FolE [Glaciihabitans sp. UYNi722]|uniref:GTP cyclohydrolase I FolE n=1 Tax=Glaciihabitans sp. UYNi722 TaxID=3156344 RepID=UPI003399A463
MASSTTDPIDTARIEAAVLEILAAIGEDPARPGLESTPRRIAQSYTEFFSGLAVNPLDFLADSAEFTADSGELSELVLLRDIEFRSMCEHHLLPFIGVAHIAYVPRSRIVGLGKLPRVVDTLASRPQLQERLTEEIADALQTGLDPLGVLVVIDAVHSCVTSRGVRQSKSSAVTMASRGILTEPVARAEIMVMIGGADE